MKLCLYAWLYRLYEIVVRPVSYFGLQPVELLSRASTVVDHQGKIETRAD